MDRLAIQKFISAKTDEPKASNSIVMKTNPALVSTTSINDLHRSMNLSARLKEDDCILYNQSEVASNTQTNLQRLSTKFTESNKSLGRKQKVAKPVLPDYLLDFGHVILGTVKTHVIRAANMGKILASFEIERQNFSKTGFLVDLEKVKNLPNEESVEFVITFDPRGANLGLGPTEHLIPLHVNCLFCCCLFSWYIYMSEVDWLTKAKIWSIDSKNFQLFFVVKLIKTDYHLSIK